MAEPRGDEPSPAPLHDRLAHQDPAARARAGDHADRIRARARRVHELDRVARPPLIIPLAFVAGCAFAAIGLYFTGIVPTIDHLNLPVFLIVLPLGFASATYFPLRHPALVAIATVNPLYHLAEGLRGLLLGD